MNYMTAEGTFDIRVIRARILVGKRGDVYCAVDFRIVEVVEGPAELLGNEYYWVFTAHRPSQLNYDQFCDTGSAYIRLTTVRKITKSGHSFFYSTWERVPLPEMEHPQEEEQDERCPRCGL